MKKRMVLGTTAAALALGAFAPAFAQPTEPVVIVETPVPAERIYVPAVRPSGAVHGGFVNPGDEVLLGDAIAALSGDKRLDGSTVTIVAKNGELIMNGSTKDVQQAAHMERLAKKVAGGRVTAWFDSMSG